MLLVASLCLFACDDDDETPVTTIKLDPAECTIKIGETRTITAHVTPQTTASDIAWSSDNTEVATVEDGLVTAISLGKANITAKLGEAQGSCQINVVAEPVTGISHIFQTFLKLT